MTTRAEREAAAVATPTIADTTFRRTAVTTAEVVQIPAALLGKYVEFSFYDTTTPTSTCAVRFGINSSVDVDLTTASTSTPPGTPTAGTKEPHLVIAAGASKHERVDPAWTHFAHIATATTGKLCFVLKTGSAN